MTIDAKRDMQADAVRRGAQRLVNAVQMQRNAALDREAELMAALGGANERIGELQAEVDRLQQELAAAKDGGS